MRNRLYDLPEELQRLIFKKTYDGVVQEIREFLHADQPYVFRKPNMMNRADTTLFAFKFDCSEEWEFRSNRQTKTRYDLERSKKEKRHGKVIHSRNTALTLFPRPFYNGYILTYFLSFGYAFLHLKKKSN